MKQILIPFLMVALSAVAMPVPDSFAHQHNPDNTAPPWSMADEYWGADKMAAARRGVQADAGAQRNFFLMADRLEGQFNDEKHPLLWDVQGWYGGDLNNFWIKTEGDYSFEEDGVTEAEVQALWSHAITPFFDLQTGIRHDAQPDGLTHGVVGIQGLAPYWFEIDAAAFVSKRGDVTARIEVGYELILTQRLILQPRAELKLAAQKIPERGTGAGVTGLDLGMRLRYEMKREIAPYIGIEWQSAFGETADIVRASGEDADRTAFLVGLRVWF